MTYCGCANDWRVYTLDLPTGRPVQILTPISLNFDKTLNQVGNGSVTVASKDLVMKDIWPHKTSILFARISGPGASKSYPVGEFIGLIDGVTADSGGMTNIGVKSIEQYLNYRHILGSPQWDQVYQTEIGARLVNLAVSDGIPLEGIAFSSEIRRDREYPESDLTPILRACENLTEVIDGPDYVLNHSIDASTGHWSTRMEWYDYAGETQPKTLNATYGVESYTLDVVALEHANIVYAIGQDPEENRSVANIYSQTDYVRFEKTKTWPDVTRQNTLDQHARGEVENSKHPLATPSLTVIGTDLAGMYNVGDTIDLHMDHGALQYRGNARIVSMSWNSTGDSASRVTFTLVPLTDAEQSILNASPQSPRCC